MSHSRSAAFMRVCQPGPPARRAGLHARAVPQAGDMSLETAATPATPPRQLPDAVFEIRERRIRPTQLAPPEREAEEHTLLDLRRLALAALPLPSALGYHRPMTNPGRHLHRGLPPHYIGPMLGAHPPLNLAPSGCTVGFPPRYALRRRSAPRWRCVASNDSRPRPQPSNCSSILARWPS